MKLPVSRCGRFKLLLSEGEDRELTPRESHFMERHRSTCAKCKREESSQFLSLNMLRAASIDAKPAAHFDERVIRLVKVQSVKESLNYWSPAFVGCALACVALFATLHVLTLESPSNSVKLKSGEAMRSPDAFPELSLKPLPPFVR